ncbi:type II toxin-antitoxin system Phd/YefM family antitoxin [Mycolicibacterium sp. 018/SC-01/001]|uniref:type II toxin-antitoxin system Phd/YefM family antitoxin n=1 Tax=Mycolicibacterium sp. 018/SC-01/001 TaxID=2592069 RepID=UPI00117BE090|nr:type II toxin-antitoxin system Phd/YefM family antitoxin [Mycolicibacterium sp. 018/SC-01/001]
MIDPSLPRVALTQLRHDFDRIIGDVERGQTFVITRRGRDVAVLLPPEDHRALASPSGRRDFIS